ncbi:hypothetical protein K449DRAFT_435609 [Hypoxylon sp. EC38]|nr:hypothetical protein K449DRAFT_435609 [Hypoxylon sp. EC38]
MQSTHNRCEMRLEIRGGKLLIGLAANSSQGISLTETCLNAVLSIRRKALKPFSFADGTTVQPGQWVCAPLASMNLDPNNHARPDEFHGFRFVPDGQRPSEIIGLSGIPLWGAGKLFMLK